MYQRVIQLWQREHNFVKARANGGGLVDEAERGNLEPCTLNRCTANGVLLSQSNPSALQSYNRAYGHFFHKHTLSTTFYPNDQEEAWGLLDLSTRILP